jgi:hypothetical protein
MRADQLVAGATRAKTWGMLAIMTLVAEMCWWWWWWWQWRWWQQASGGGGTGGGGGALLWGYLSCGDVRSVAQSTHTSTQAHKHTRQSSPSLLIGESTRASQTLVLQRILQPRSPATHARARTPFAHAHTTPIDVHRSPSAIPLRREQPTVHTASQRTASSTTSNTRTALTSWCTPRPSRTFPSSASTRHAADHARTTTATSRGFAASTQRSSTRKLSRNGQSLSTVSNVPSRHPSLASSQSLLASNHPPPATRLQPPATRHSPPVNHHPPLTFWTPTHIRHLICHGPIARASSNEHHLLLAFIALAT